MLDLTRLATDSMYGNSSSLRDQGSGGDPQRDDVNPLHRIQLFELPQGRPQHADANDQQQCPEHQRGRGFDSLVAVRVAAVGFLLAVMAGKQHDEIRHYVGQRMDVVRDEPLRLGGDPEGDLRRRQQQVGDDADPGAAGPRRRRNRSVSWGRQPR